MKVLIGEDQAQLQSLLKLSMRKWGYDSDVAPDGFKAFKLAKRNPYDICIMDLNMPGMDGLEAARKIRSELPFFPIMALTGNPDSDKERCLKAGMNDFLKKPFDLRELHDKILELTVRMIKLEIRKDDISITSEKPSDRRCFDELRKLYKKGLIKLIFTGSGREYALYTEKSCEIPFNRIYEKHKIIVTIEPSLKGKCTNTSSRNAGKNAHSDEIEKQLIKKYELIVN